MGRHVVTRPSQEIGARGLLHHRRSRRQLQGGDRRLRLRGLGGTTRRGDEVVTLHAVIQVDGSSRVGTFAHGQRDDRSASRIDLAKREILGRDRLGFNRLRSRGPLNRRTRGSDRSRGRGLTTHIGHIALDVSEPVDDLFQHPVDGVERRLRALFGVLLQRLQRCDLMRRVRAWRPMAPVIRSDAEYLPRGMSRRSLDARSRRFELVE